jgi:hypothetical protein
VFETGDNVVGIPHYGHVAGGLMPSPALGPEVEGIVQIDIGQER